MSNFEISSGIIPSAQKIVIYGPEGIGKSTFAGRFPGALFIDTEGSTKAYPFRRLPAPSSWQMLKDEIDHVKQNMTICQTLVIDTFDWAESLCVRFICDNANKKGIEDFGYGKGYIYEKEEIARLLHSLDEVVALGIHVVLTAHAQLRKIEQPENTGTYDHWELKLGQKTGSQISPMVKEWADLVLFANYKTIVVAQDDNGQKYKANGGRRVMYTTHTPWWDAKNRYGLPEECDFNFDAIAGVLKPYADGKIYGQQPEAVPGVREAEQKLDAILDEPQAPQIPKALADLMNADGITEADIRMAVAEQGFYPADVPVVNYDADLINGLIIGQWEGLKNYINSIKGDKKNG